MTDLLDYEQDCARVPLILYSIVDLILERKSLRQIISDKENVCH